MTGPAIREFVLPLMVGVIVGCISSITVCSPIYRDLCNLTGGPKYKGKKSRKGKKNRKQISHHQNETEAAEE